MKCNNCGADNLSGANVCKFCASPLSASPLSVSSTSASSDFNTSDVQSIVLRGSDPFNQTFNWLSDLHKAPTTQFNIVAFLFNAIWLAGRGNLADSIRVLCLFNVSVVLSFVFSLLGHAAPAFIGVAQIGLNIFVAYLIGSHSHALVKNEQFDWGKAILVMVCYWIALAVVEYFVIHNLLVG